MKSPVIKVFVDVSIQTRMAMASEATDNVTEQNKKECNCSRQIHLELAVLEIFLNFIVKAESICLKY